YPEFRLNSYIGGVRSGNYYYNWTQDNFYITPKKGYPVKDTEVWNGFFSVDPNNVSFRRFTYLTNHDQLHLLFFWDTLQENRTAGCGNVSRNFSEHGYPEITAHPQVQIYTTPRADAISVSKLYFQAPRAAFWGQEEYYKPQFNFHDIYGNQSGDIQIIVNEDHQSFHLEDA
ncbi:hypothetical protein, partial [Xenorhabdus doucetiae]|uniref:hypothetical protein n=1 Tax=Xenorhabdus doucetiae TaxID=351671 RepID=UPI002B409435